MKKATICISMDEEKLSAVRMYLEKKNVDLDETMAGQLEKLYEKFVPLNVREFIADRYVDDDTAKKKPDGK